jgi:hypothetical protein
MTCDRLEHGDLLGHLGETMDPHVQECGDCRARAGQYARLAASLALESDRPLPDDWKQRALERLRRERTGRKRRTALTGGLAAALTVAVVVFATRRDSDRPPPGQLVVSLEEGGGTWRGSAHPGMRWHLSAAPDSSGRFELWVYRDERELVLRCADAAPQTSTCRHRDGGVEATVRLVSVGQYDAILLVSPWPLPTPGGDLNADLKAARRAGAHVVDDRWVDVH